MQIVVTRVIGLVTHHVKTCLHWLKGRYFLRSQFCNYNRVLVYRMIVTYLNFVNKLYSRKYPFSYFWSTMSMLSSSFDFQGKPWWRPSYDERDTHFFLSEITRHHKRLNTYFERSMCVDFVNRNECHLILIGYLAHHKDKYALECISVESALVPNNTTQFSPRICKKIQNIRNALNKVFPWNLFHPCKIKHFTPSLAKQLHTLVGDGLIDDAGRYRTKHVMAAQESLVYLSPALIEKKMDLLFSECRERFGKTRLSIEEAIKYGSCFLVHFLYIHPFINGNGRVARLLISYLFLKYTGAPFSLYNGTNSREIYLQCLREARQYPIQPPRALAALILETIYKSLYNTCAVLDLPS